MANAEESGCDIIRVVWSLAEYNHYTIFAVWRRVFDVIYVHYVITFSHMDCLV